MMAAAAASTVDESTSEVEIDIRARGSIGDVLEGYITHMRKNFAHIKAVDSKTLEKLVAILVSADKEEVRDHWRFTVADVKQWSGYDDSNLRVIMPGRCKGETYKKLKQAICADIELAEDFVDDILVLVLFNACMEEDKYDMNELFELDKKGTVSLLLDSCSFDPRKAGGDELFLSFDEIAAQMKTVEAVFPHGELVVETVGRFEHISSEAEETDEAEEDSDDQDDSDYDCAAI